MKKETIQLIVRMILTAFLIIMVALDYKWALIVTLSLLAIGIEATGFVLEKYIKKYRS